MNVDTSPLRAQEPRELVKNKWSKWIVQGAVVGLVASMVLVLVGGAGAITQAGMPSLQAAKLLASSNQTPGTQCPPKEWIYKSLEGGHWIIEGTDPESWGWYMSFLNVSKSQWPAEFHASDMHQYIFWTNDTGVFYIMNHTIPSTGFHLLFESDSNGLWRPNPYPVLTPAGFDPSAAKVDLEKVRYVFEESGTPFADSCHAWRCDMPMVKNVTIGDKIVAKEFVVSFWRELTSPTSMRCTLYITDAESGEAIIPWSDPGYGPDPVATIPGNPKRLSYRYFRKTVQSMEDAMKRMPCKKSGLPGDDHEFC